MSENIKSGWLKDHTGVKFAPQTLDTLIYNKEAIQLKGLDKTIYPEITESSETFTDTFQTINTSNLDNKILLSTKRDDVYYFFTSTGLTTLAPGGSTVTTNYKGSNGAANPFSPYSRITFYEGGNYFFAGTSYGWTVDSGTFDDNWYRMTLYYSQDGITWIKGWQSADWGGANESGQYHQPVFYWNGSQIRMYSLYNYRVKQNDIILGTYYIEGNDYLSIVTGSLSGETWTWSENHSQQIATLGQMRLNGGGKISSGSIILFYSNYKDVNQAEFCGYLYSTDGVNWTNKNGAIHFNTTGEYIAQQFKDINGYGLITTKGYIYHAKSLSSGYKRTTTWAGTENPPVADAYPEMHVNHPIFIKNNCVYINYYTYYRKFYIGYNFDHDSFPELVTDDHWDTYDKNLLYFDNSGYHAYFCPVDNKLIITNNNKCYIYNISNFNLENYNFNNAEGKLKDTQNNEITSQVFQILQQYKTINGNTKRSYISLPVGAVPRFVSFSKDGVSTGLLPCDSTYKYSLDGKNTNHFYWRKNSQLYIDSSSHIAYTILYETPLDYHMINLPNPIIHLGYDSLNAPFSNYTRWIDLLLQESQTSQHIYEECLSNGSYLIKDANNNIISIYQKIVDTPGYLNLTVKTNWAKYLAEPYYDQRTYIYWEEDQKIYENKIVKESPILTLSNTPFIVSTDYIYRRELNETNGHFSFKEDSTITINNTTTWDDLIGCGIIFESEPSMVYVLETQTSSTDSDSGEITYQIKLLPQYTSYLTYRPTGESLNTYSETNYNTLPGPLSLSQVVQGSYGTNLVTKENNTYYYYSII